MKRATDTEQTQQIKPLPRWQSGRFAEVDNDPLSGFANIMDIMLVFAVGLMLALFSQSQELRQRFKLEKGVEVSSGKELVEPPESIEDMLQGDGSGMESLGQVYRDPKTGKLILVSGK